MLIQLHGPPILQIALRNINIGDEVTINYGATRENSIEERQTRLLTGYYFLCNCTACVEDSRTVLALQCPVCPGPVLVYSGVYWDGDLDTHCLACGTVLSGTYDKLVQLTQAREQLAILTKLHSLIFGRTSTNGLETNNTMVVKHCLERIKELIYAKSNLLIEACYDACRMFAKEGLIEMVSLQ